MQVSHGFQENIKKYVMIDNKIKSAQEIIRDLKKEKEGAAENILIYIKTNNIEDVPINISGGKIKYSVSKTTAPMSKQYIQQRLAQYFKSESKAKEVVDFLYNDRETKEKETIKRIKSRGQN